MTNLPASDEAYDKSMFQQTMTLQESLRTKQPRNLSSMAGVIFMAYFFGQNLSHLHRPEPNEREDDLQGEFWKRHRRMDNTMLNISLSLPQHLRLTAGVREPKVVFLNMGIHTAAISLHQAAIFKAETNALSSNVIEQSQLRCLVAAGEIATIMRLVSHLDPAAVSSHPVEQRPKLMWISDESVHGVLSLCCSSCIRPVFEEDAESAGMASVIGISPQCYERAQTKKPSFRVISHAVDLGHGGHWLR